MAKGTNCQTDQHLEYAERHCNVRREKVEVDLHTEGDVIVPVRPNAFKRCVTNLIDNADRYATHVSVRAGKRGDAIDVTIDDNGPGIPSDKLDDVFKPFFRLDESRNQGTGGVGLGLTIARDVIRGMAAKLAWRHLLLADCVPD